MYTALSRGVLLTVATLVLLSLTSLQAGAVSLDSLFNGADLTVGDKRFYDWILEDDSSTIGFNADPAPRDFTQIDVTTVSPDPLIHGVKYTDNGNQLFSGGGTADITLYTYTYRVEQINDLALIIDNELDMRNNFFVDTANLDFGTIFIDEDVFKADGTTRVVPGDPTKRLQATGDGAFPTVDFDSVVFPAESDLFIRTNVNIAGGFGDAFVSMFEQTFSQLDPPGPGPGPGPNIPEPSTFALAALGLLSLGFVGWRRRRR